MTIKVHGCQDTGGGSTCPLAHLNSPIFIYFFLFQLFSVICLIYSVCKVLCKPFFINLPHRHSQCHLTSEPSEALQNQQFTDKLTKKRKKERHQCATQLLPKRIASEIAGSYHSHSFLKRNISTHRGKGEREQLPAKTSFFLTRFQVRTWK